MAIGRASLAGKEHQVVHDGHFFVKAAFFRQIAHAVANAFAGWLASQGDGSSIREVDVHDGANGRRLAGAVASDQSEDCSTGGREADAVYCSFLTERF
jgi:hypothetical protein